MLAICVPMSPVAFAVCAASALPDRRFELRHELAHLGLIVFGDDAVAQHLEEGQSSIEPRG
jgi:hypothetical protein